MEKLLVSRADLLGSTCLLFDLNELNQIYLHTLQETMDRSVSLQAPETVYVEKS
jgi:hypothetical protein